MLYTGWYRCFPLYMYNKYVLLQMYFLLLLQYQLMYHHDTVLQQVHLNTPKLVSDCLMSSYYPHPMQSQDVMLFPLYSTDCDTNNRYPFQILLFLQYQNKNCLDIHRFQIQIHLTYHSKVLAHRDNQILSIQILRQRNHIDKCCR